MATENVTADTPSTPANEKRRVLFEPFEWLPHEHTLNVQVAGARVAALACSSRDVANGVRALMQIFERDDIDRDFRDDEGLLPAMLNDNVRGALTRLAIASLDMLNQEAERMMSHLGQEARRN